MDDLYYYGLLILSYFVGVLMTSLFFLKKIAVWRIRWIEMEHDLARLQHRTPRNIDSL